MKFMKLNILFRVLHPIFSILSLSTGENNKELNTFEYTLSTELFRSMSLSDQATQEYLEELKYTYNQDAVTNYLKNIASPQAFPKVDKTVINLYSTLELLMDQNCLVVINNFENADMPPTAPFPAILRQFELGVGRVSYVEPSNKQLVSKEDILWIPTTAPLSKLNGNFSTQPPNLEDVCFIVRYLYSAWPPDTSDTRCSGPKSFNFLWKSRPWQCEVQVDLFMPDNLLRLGKFTEVFERLCSRRLDIMPNLRTPVHILVDTKENVAEYEWEPLATWTIKRNKRFRRGTYHPISNHIQVIGHVVCQLKFRKLHPNLNCNIQNFNVLFPCPHCKHFVNTNAAKPGELSWEKLEQLDNAQKFVAFPGKIYSPKLESLGAAIAYYTNFEPEKTKLPLKYLNSLNLRLADKIRMLGFGYASIFTLFMGNSTAPLILTPENYKYRYFTDYLNRETLILDETYKVYDSTIRLANGFGQLHFLSCGSRGIQPFPFVQFVSVFKWQVWLFIFISIILLSFSIVKMYKDGKAKISNKLWPLCIYKVLVEQGDPFPPNFDKGIQMRFLMSATFMAGVVISNAFKSENVYNIVLPRAQISYHNIDQLIQDNVTLYNRIKRFQIQEFFAYHKECLSLMACSDEETGNDMVGGIWKGPFLLTFWSELLQADRAPIFKDSLKMSNYSRIHGKANDSLIESLKLLDDFATVGILNAKSSLVLVEGSILYDRFNDLQEKLINSSLNECSKTAWMLPNYLAQIIHRSLKKSKKHSDVSSHSYTWSEISFSYDKAYVPSSILRRYSFILATGLFEWWPRFINSTDLFSGTENKIPTKPTMSGNILVIFVLLASGISFAIACFGLELSLYLVKRKKVCKRCTGMRQKFIDKFANYRNKSQNFVVVVKFDT